MCVRDRLKGYYEIKFRFFLLSGNIVACLSMRVEKKKLWETQCLKSLEEINEESMRILRML